MVKNGYVKLKQSKAPFFLSLKSMSSMWYKKTYLIFPKPKTSLHVEINPIQYLPTPPKP